MNPKRVLVTLIGICLAVTAAEAQGRGGQAQVPAQTAWWTDAALMTRLGLTDLQKARIESAYQAHKPLLAVAMANLEKEEAQLSKLLEAESVDRSGVQLQAGKVIQARAQMESVNVDMTLEMREQLTPAQWAQLQMPAAGARGSGGRGGAPPANPAPDSFAARYDATKPVTLDGRVAEFRFIDPHSLILIDVAGKDGKTSTWTGEIGPARLLSQQGWTASTLKAGDMIRIEGSHSRDPNENLVNLRTIRRLPDLTIVR